MFFLRTAALLSLILCSTTAAAGLGDLMKKLDQHITPLETTEPKATQQPAKSSGIAEGTLIQGLKEALRVGSERTVKQLSAADGFMANPAVRIPLPEQLTKASRLLRRYGLGSTIDQLEESLNRAAERAAPAASEHLLSALEGMQLKDAEAIYRGGDHAATDYFQARTGAAIEADFRPIIETAMQEAGVSRYYQQLVKQASRYPLVGDLDLDLIPHTSQSAVDGLFRVLAEQESLIRKDPVARSTDLLKQVFGR